MNENNQKDVRISGVVTGEVVHNEDESCYRISSSGKEYAIISTGRQAVKDNLFIRKGQHMIVEGKKTSEYRSVLSEKSRILLKMGGDLYGRETT